MTQLILARFGQAIMALFGVSLLVWALLLLTPGDPAERILQARGVTEITPTRVASLRQELGLNQPLPLQYISWMGGVLRGQFGISYVSRRPVQAELLRRAPATALLAGCATLWAVTLAVPLALLAARYPDRWPDHLARLVALAGATLPSFWLGLLLLDLVAVQLGWTRVISQVNLRHVLVPGFILGLGLAALLTRLLRAGLLAELGQRYALVAAARGASAWRIVLRHALPNAAVPSLQVLALGIGGLLGGAAIVETVFTWPGIGFYVVEAIGARDLPVIQGFTLLAATTFIVVNLFVDLALLALDPRQRSHS